MQIDSVQESLEQLARRLRASTVAILDGNRGAGSGILWDAGGIVVTNAHVVTQNVARVRLESGATVRGDVIGRSVRADVAVLQIPARAVSQGVDVRAAGTLRPGEIVVAVGNPLGIPGAVTTGIVHTAPTARWQWIEADLRLAPGNSGGPLADAAGRVVGVNSMVVRGTLALAIPSEIVESFVALCRQSPAPGVAATSHERRIDSF